jgi:hypothetical protein
MGCVAAARDRAIKSIGAEVCVCGNTGGNIHNEATFISCGHMKALRWRGGRRPNSNTSISENAQTLGVVCAKDQVYVINGAQEVISGVRAAIP